MSAEANVGVVGLAAMGGSLARNLAHHGNKVAVFNRTYARTEKLMNEHGTEGEFYPAKTLEEFVDSLVKPRTAIIMVKAGEPTDAMINALADLMEPGDIIVDAGNAYFPDTIRREHALAEKGLHFVGVGVSGGEEGALWGPSMMPGGSAESYKHLGPMLEKIAAKAPQDGAPCCAWISTDGAGHFVKMVHNGIEYGMMQAIGEGFALMEASDFDYDLKAVAHNWNCGSVVRSWLMELMEQQLGEHPGLEDIRGVVDASGEAKWTVETALDLEVPVPVIALSLMTRNASHIEDSFANKAVAAMRNGFGGHAIHTK